MMGGVPFVLASAADTFMTVMLVIVIVLGYVVIWALWRKGFRGKGPEANELVAEPLNRSGRDLAEELWEFEVWLRQRTPGAGWERMTLTEVDMSTGGARGPELTAVEFAPRFSEILGASQRDAVALEALGIEEDRLLVAVNWASQPKAGDARRARLPVTVRYHAADP